MTQTLITPTGLARLRKELEHLRTTARQEIAERIRHAVSSERNMAENGDYHDAREEQALLERRIAILQERIADAEVVDPDAENGVLDVGERVRLRDLENGEEIQYELVGSLEADPFAGRISAASPLGRAVLGRRGGEVATVDAPKGPLRFEILEIEASARDGVH
jgi:transcription elongation factor GreA